VDAILPAFGLLSARFVYFALLIASIYNLSFIAKVVRFEKKIFAVYLCQLQAVKLSRFISLLLSSILPVHLSHWLNNNHVHCECRFHRII